MKPNAEDERSMTLQIRVPPTDEIERLCKRYHIRKLSLFGSVLRSDFDQDSDIDILVEFESGKTPRFFKLIDIQDELSDLFGKQVDLRTPNDLSRYFRDDILETAEVQYDARG